MHTHFTLIKSTNAYSDRSNLYHNQQFASNYLQQTQQNLSVLIPWLINTLRPRQNDRQFSNDIFKCSFLMEIYKFQLRFHSSLFPSFQLTIFHYLNQWCLFYWRIYASFGLHDLKKQHDKWKIWKKISPLYTIMFEILKSGQNVFSDR